MAEQHSNCGNCRFFRHQQIMGICRESPQQQNKHQNDWCGEHQIKMLTLPVYDIMTDTTTQVPTPKKPGRKPKDGSQPAA